MANKPSTGRRLLIATPGANTYPVRARQYENAVPAEDPEDEADVEE